MLRREDHARRLGRKLTTAAGAGAVVCDTGLGRREVLDMLERVRAARHGGKEAP